MGPFAVAGRDVVHGVGFRPDPGVASRVTYDIGGNYTTLQVDLVIGDGGNPVGAHFDVVGDGTPLLNDVEVSPVDGLVHKEISVAGVQLLTLEAAVTNGSSEPQAMFGNPRLVPSGGSAVPTTALPSSPAAAAVWLDDGLSPTDAKPYYVGPFAVAGRDVVHGVGFRPDPGVAWVVTYEIGGRFATLEVDLVIGDGGNPVGAHFDVVRDGTPLPDGGFEVSPADGLVHKEISVAGVRRLMLVVTVTKGSSEPQAMFGSARLVP